MMASTQIIKGIATVIALISITYTPAEASPDKEAFTEALDSWFKRHPLQEVFGVRTISENSAHVYFRIDENASGSIEECIGEAVRTDSGQWYVISMRCDLSNSWSNTFIKID